MAKNMNVGTIEQPLSNQERLDQMRERVHGSQIYREIEAREAFVERIYDLMESRNISRAELARRIGCTPAYITRILGGGVNFTIETLVKICDAFEQELILGCRPRMEKSVAIENAAVAIEKIVELPAAQAEKKFELSVFASKKSFQKGSASWQTGKGGVLTPRAGNPWKKWDNHSSQSANRNDSTHSDCGGDSSPLLRYGS